MQTFTYKAIDKKGKDFGIDGIAFIDDRPDKRENKLQQIIGTNLETMSSLFGKKVINLNNFLNIDLNENLKIDEKSYLDYKHSYIKRKGSEELPFWQVFANRVKLLNE